MAALTDDRRLDDVLEVLTDVIFQACGTPDGRVDSMSLTAYSKAIQVLDQYGRVRIESQIGRRVIARLVALN